MRGPFRRLTHARAEHRRRAAEKQRYVVEARAVDGGGTDAAKYWNDHTVNSVPLANAGVSLDYLEWRFGEYPLFRELSGLWGEHDGEVVLDYGCGPGNDVIGFLVHTGASKVIGADVSAKALELARGRISLHDVDPERVKLIQVSDAAPETGLEDDSVDYVQAIGSLQHASDPMACLREMRRVLKPDVGGRIMVYNRDSVWLHLYVAFQKMIVEGLYEGLNVEDAFATSTDGENCPIAACFRPEEFLGLLTEGGFEAEYLGAYLSKVEIDSLQENREAAIADERLGEEHRSFLSELSIDEAGMPMWRGKHAGIGAVYRIRS